MPYLTNSQSSCQGLYNYIAETEVRIYGKILTKEDLSEDQWTLYFGVLGPKH